MSSLETLAPARQSPLQVCRIVIHGTTYSPVPRAGPRAPSPARLGSGRYVSDLLGGLLSKLRAVLSRSGETHRCKSLSNRPDMPYPIPIQFSDYFGVYFVFKSIIIQACGRVIEASDTAAYSTAIQEGTASFSILKMSRLEAS